MPEKEPLNNDSKELASTEKKLPGANDEGQIDERLSYAAVKGIFFTPKSDNAGAFCIIYRGETGKVIFRELWAVRSNYRPSSNISDRWETFIKEMDKIGAYDRDSAEKLMPLIIESLSDNIKEYLFRNISEIETAKTEIRKTLENVFRYVVEVEIECELLGEERAERGGLLRNKEESADSPATTAVDDDSEALLDIVNIGGIPLMCQPVIDPIYGCPVSRIKTGDIVHVSIPESNDISKKIMDYVRFGGLEAAFPVTLVQSLESGKCVVVLKINEEIRGVLSLAQDVMLRTNVAPVKKDTPLDRLKQLFSDPVNCLIAWLFLSIVILLYLIMRII